MKNVCDLIWVASLPDIIFWKLQDFDSSGRILLRKLWFLRKVLEKRFMLICAPITSCHWKKRLVRDVYFCCLCKEISGCIAQSDSKFEIRILFDIKFLWWRLANSENSNCFEGSANKSRTIITADSPLLVCWWAYIDFRMRLVYTVLALFRCVNQLVAAEAVVPHRTAQFKPSTKSDACAYTVIGRSLGSRHSCEYNMPLRKIVIIFNLWR